jgi:hypothetical protein
LAYGGVERGVFDKVLLFAEFFKPEVQDVLGRGDHGAFSGG